MTTPTIIDELNAKVARDRASDDEVARIVGMTPEEFDADTTAADPTHGWHDVPADLPELREYVILCTESDASPWSNRSPCAQIIRRGGSLRLTAQSWSWTGKPGCSERSWGRTG